MAFQTSREQLSFREELRLVLRDRNLSSQKSKENKNNENDNVYSMEHPTHMNSDRNRLRGFRCQAVQEIVDTEKAYLSQLQLLIKYFVIPCKERRLIDTNSHTMLFGQIEMIHSLNTEFLNTLESDIDNVAQAFVKIAPFFKLYSIYAFDYRNALLVLQDLTSKNPIFRKFLEETESRPEVQQKLISLLIVPIQRVPRYKLLLQQVLYYTSPADTDFKILRESIKQIESTVEHINSCVEDQETTQMLINLQNSLYNRMPNIIMPSRKVIKEGILQKVTRKGAEIKRYCVLMSDIFMYCKILKNRAPNTHVANSLECCCIFPLNKCKIYEMFPGNFKLACQGDGIIFSTTDLQLQRTWVTLIRNAIELHFECRKTLRKESSKRTPLRKKAVKNFGIDYVLSPNKRKGEYETIFRNENRSSDSDDDSEDSTCRKRGCIEFSNCRKQHDINMLKNRKRRACENLKDSHQSNSIAPSKRLKKFDTCKQKTTADMQSNAASSSIVVNSNMNYDPSYGFVKCYSDTKTYFRACNVDSTIPTTFQRKNVFQTHDLPHGKDILELDDMPLKKRVKFRDDHAINVKRIETFLPHTDTVSKSDQAPLYQKIWNFFSKLL